MPFKIDDTYMGDSIDFANGRSTMLIGQKFYIIDASEVDQEHDRIAVTLSHGEQSTTCRLSLNPSPTGYGLLLDTVHSDRMFVEVITSAMKLGDLYELTIVCEIIASDPAQRKIILPSPITFGFFRDGKYLNESVLWVAKGGTIKLEPETIS
jgi:hypothetical protein